MGKRYKTLLPAVITVIGVAALASLILMAIWNGFVVPAVGLEPLSYWLAVKGILLVGFIVTTVLGIRQIINFVVSSIVFYFFKKRTREMVATHEALTRHFSDFRDNN